MTRGKMPAALIPAAAIIGFAALAAGPAFGWADALWICWGALFALLEGNAVLNKTEGNTLSERTRAWFRTKTPAGRFGFTALLVTFVAWFIPHILG